MSDEERRESFSEEGGKPEAQVKMEADVKRRKEKAEEEWKEYEEMRKSEKEKESEEIRLLRERREQRKKERAAEEQRLAELRAVEEQKRRAEDEERQRRKRDEEQNRREEREIKNKEAEERSKITNRPNFIINKRSDDDKLISDEPTKEEVAKSKEQLEAERKAILEQRIQTLAIDGFDLQKLKEKAKELHQAIYKLESEKYDLEQQFQRQTLDLMELAERARQMNKGGKGQKVNVAQTDALPSKMSRAPPKVVMYSQYERVKDPRSFRDRSTVFDGPLYADYFTKIEARFKVQMGEQGAEVCGDAGSTPADSEVPMEA